MEFTNEEIEKYEAEIKKEELANSLLERESSASEELTKEELDIAKTLNLKPSEYLKSKNKISIRKRDVQKMQKETADKLWEGLRKEKPENIVELE